MFAFYMLLNHSRLEIDNVRVIGADEKESAIISAAALQLLDGKYMNIFSRSNFLIYPVNKIEKYIPQVTAKVMDASVSLDGLHTIEIKITNREPDAIICASLPESLETDAESTDIDCYLADKNGLIFDKAPLFSGVVYDRFFIPALSEKATTTGGLIGEYATTSEIYSEMRNIYNTVAKIIGEVFGVLIKDGGEYEIYIKNPIPGSSDNRTAVIYMNKNSSISEQLDNLNLFWLSITKDKNGKVNVPQFDYIDLRYGSSIFFKEF